MILRTLLTRVDYYTDFQLYLQAVIADPATIVNATYKRVLSVRPSGHVWSLRRIFGDLLPDWSPYRWNGTDRFADRHKAKCGAEPDSL